MKIYLHVFPMVLALFLQACEIDTCKGVVCQNNGTCEDGYCNCQPGFEGESCEQATDVTSCQTLLQGYFSVSESCYTSNFSYTSFLEYDTTGNTNEVRINGLFDGEYDVYGEYDCYSHKITIPSQSVEENVSVSGTGTIDAGAREITIEFERKSNSGGTYYYNDCTAVFK